MRRLLLPAAMVLLPLGACRHKPAAVVPPTPSPAVRARVDTVVLRDAEADRRIARLELKVIERDAQLADLQSRLEDARQEVVRAMAKLETIASRAEAASGIAEAEVALQTLRAGQVTVPEAGQVAQLLAQSSAEFDKQNFGGALYLANQAKTLAVRGGSSGVDLGAPREGETLFAVPLGLKTVGRGNVREGPGTSFRLVFAAEAGMPLTGYSYVDEWIRVADDSGRAGWIFRNLVGGR